MAILNINIGHFLFQKKKSTPKNCCNDMGGLPINFTKNGYIAYIIGKSLTDFRVCFHGAISSTSKK